VIPVQLSGDASDDKLKHIGHSIHFGAAALSHDVPSA
jgi:hypothetical protein